MTLKLAGDLTLDNGTRAQAIAGVAPTLDYRFARDKREIETVSLTDKLTFTGGNQGTFVGSDGYIQRATTNVPRFDHDPVSLVSEGVLVEGSRTNLLKASEDISTADWIRERGTQSSSTVAKPSGSTASTPVVWIEDTSSSATHRIIPTVITGTVADYTFSAFLKAKERTRARVTVWTGANERGLDANLATGTVTPVNSPNSFSIAAFANGWYRVSVTATFSAASCFGLIYSANDSGNTLYTGDGTSGIYLWGAQLEQGSTPSTYIPTTTTAVTRTADSAVIDGTGVLTGTYTMVAKPEGSAQVSGSNIELQEGYTTERVMVFPAALSAAQITAIREAM